MNKTTLTNKLIKLIDVKSIVTLMLTIVFCYMAVVNSISSDFLTIYTVVIAFYFGIQVGKGGSDGKTD